MKLLSALLASTAAVSTDLEIEPPVEYQLTQEEKETALSSF